MKLAQLLEVRSPWEDQGEGQTAGEKRRFRDRWEDFNKDMAGDHIYVDSIIKRFFEVAKAHKFVPVKSGHVGELHRGNWYISYAISVGMWIHGQGNTPTEIFWSVRDRTKPHSKEDAYEYGSAHRHVADDTHGRDGEALERFLSTHARW